MTVTTTSVANVVADREQRRSTRSKTRKVRAYATNGKVGKMLDRARDLQNQIAALKDQLDPIREQLLAHCNDKNLDNLTTEGGFQCLRKVRHNWDYSAETEREMLKVRNSQKWEQQQGIASDRPTFYIQLGDKKK